MFAGGYSDRKLSQGRYRVTFTGNRLTSREIRPDAHYRP